MKDTVKLDKQIIERAKIVACKIEEKNIRKRAYALNIAAAAAAEYINAAGLTADTKNSLHKVASFIKNFELADIYIGALRLDVRVTFNAKTFCIPKIHEKYDARPCAYVVVQLDSSSSNARIMGFIPTSELEVIKTESEYLCYETSILKPLSELKAFVSSVELKQSVYSSMEHEKIKELSVPFIDDEIAQSEKVYFIKHIIACPVCREIFCDMNDFDVIVSQLKNYHELLSDSTLSVFAGNQQEFDSALLASLATVENAQEDSDTIQEPEEIEEIQQVEEIEEAPAAFEEESFLQEDGTLQDLTDDEEPVEDEILLPAEEAVLEISETPEILETSDALDSFNTTEVLDNLTSDDVSGLSELAEIADVSETQELIDTQELESSADMDLNLDTDLDLTADIQTDDLSAIEQIEPVAENPEEEKQPVEEDELTEQNACEAEVQDIQQEEIPHEDTSEVLAVSELEPLEPLEPIESVEETLLEQPDTVDGAFEETLNETAETVLLETEPQELLSDDEPMELLEEEPLEEIQPVELETAEHTEHISEESLETETEDDIATEDVSDTELLETPQDIILEHDEEALDTLEIGDLETLDSIEEQDSLDEAAEKTVEEKPDPSEELCAQEEPEQINVDSGEEFLQEPVELVYDEEELPKDNQTQAETESYKEDTISLIEDEPVFETRTENESADDSDIRGLLDDDLLALLSDEESSSQPSESAMASNSESVFDENEAKEKPEEIYEQTDEAFQEADEEFEGDDTIESLFEGDESDSKQGEEKQFELAQEPVSEKTVNATKKIIVGAAILMLLAGGGVTAWLVNNAKTAANNAALDAANQDELSGIKNRSSDSDAPAISQDINKSMANSFSDKPAAITVTKISWQVSEKLAQEASVKEYLQTAGKNIQMNLQNDLANAADINFNNSIKVSFEIAPDNTMKGMQVLESSGSDQIDDSVMRSIKNTLKYVSVPKLKDFKSDYFLTLIINF